MDTVRRLRCPTATVDVKFDREYSLCYYIEGRFLSSVSRSGVAVEQKVMSILKIPS